MKIFGFEKLKVWQKARQLSMGIYRLTATYPSEEKFVLISQMRRCSISIASNIAEGSGRHSPKDKARFTEIAYSSPLELLNQAIVSNDLEYMKEQSLIEIRQAVSEITAMLDGLYKSQLKK